MNRKYHITDFGLGELPRAEQLVSDYKYKPFYFVHAVPNEKLNILAHRRLMRFLGGQKNDAFALTDETGDIIALAGIQPLDWDTDILGVGCGRIPFMILSGNNEEKARQSRALLAEITARARKAGIEMLTIRTSAQEFGLIHPLEDAGFRIMDNGMTALYHKSVYYKYEKKEISLREYRDGDLPAILDITAGAYNDDRFHNDPRIPYEKAEEIYAKWITRSCTEPGQDEHVMVAEQKGEIVGFFQYQPVHDFNEATGVQIHSCGLAAVLRDKRGLGIYHSMLSSAIKLFVEKGTVYGMTRIPFSIQPILKLTLRLGPSFMVNDLTFHLWLD